MRLQVPFLWVSDQTNAVGSTIVIAIVFLAVGLALLSWSSAVSKKTDLKANKESRKRKASAEKEPEMARKRLDAEDVAELEEQSTRLIPPPDEKRIEAVAPRNEHAFQRKGGFR